MMTPFYKSNDKAFTLLKGDCVELLDRFDFKFEMIFADPPYFLSNDGISVQSGKMVSVNKGEWDRSNGFEKDNEFNLKWLKACKEHLIENGTIWISGTFHNIFSVAQMLTELDYKILNCITWAKTNPPPNLSCRYFTHSTEFIIWARKSKKSSHFYNYELMKTINGGTQMKDVWNLPAIAPWEKSCGKHPTQKPLALLTRIILASTEKNAWVLDPFTGSSTTGIAANLVNRKFLGIDKEEEFLNISKKRKHEIENPQIFGSYRKKIGGFKDKSELGLFLAKEPDIEYERSLKI
ncbi:MAG: site-specific DNA-methyltransferase [Prolixibacteraceae bacterium]|nr:site-specific DNA-methyltransferase [Prolixibacteraceae bacterium]